VIGRAAVRNAFLGSLFAVAGCGMIDGDLPTQELCRGVADADLRAALGIDDKSGLSFTMESGSCLWSAPSDDGRPRAMRASIQRERDLKRALPPRTGVQAFEEALQALEKDYPRTRVLGGLGEATVMGFGAIGKDRFAGGLVARKAGDVLNMQIEGDDPAAFEAAARSIAERM
jgi:hypothetical protein